MAELAVPAIRDWDFPRSTASIQLISQFAAERGLPAARLLAGTSLEPAALRDPALQVDARQELAVIRALVAALCAGGEDGDELALALGKRYHVSTFGIFGFACISSPTLRDAMLFALRYLDLSFTFCIPHVVVDGPRIVLRMDDARVPGDVARFLVLRDLGAIYTVMRDLLPSICLSSLEFAHEAPAATKSYVDAFGRLPVFGAPAHAAGLDPAYLEQPLPQANEQTVAICAAQCHTLVARKRERTGISHLVRERLVRFGGVDAGMDEIARQLSLSPRTLRRRLAEAGTGYRGLVDEVRQALAEEMLDTGALSVEDVALRLGYAEASSFIYAFKRWKGMTPAAYARRSSSRARPGR
ncbi:AraC family transcriptional regulator [Amycolatopsis sp. H20-H5]|uniref:AraC family transcriptional regulator n=1 Tax=Amycolatopsis sp. H20-H5 TaxID=3046309 RepID=UPI002DBEE51F|nr:AraC family transcriptional regulator [Amycolatopsis sp. H20-H5]MEC3977601.1 AraC family transcriptional regulator [Amycolatopsis sp. H20-H5]